jgi:hypothetical protein
MGKLRESGVWDQGVREQSVGKTGCRIVDREILIQLTSSSVMSRPETRCRLGHKTRNLEKCAKENEAVSCFGSNEAKRNA